jgi:hypothetical protein
LIISRCPFVKGSNEPGKMARLIFFLLKMEKNGKKWKTKN